MPEDRSEHEIDNPFDGEAWRLVRDAGIDLNRAKNLVVFRDLRLGDTRALAHWLMQDDYEPDKAVRFFLSYMLQPRRNDPHDPSVSDEVAHDRLLYRLDAKRRDGKKGRPNDPTAAEINTMISDYYEKKLAELGPGGSEAVVAEMADEFGPHVSESRIREAIKERSPKSRGGGKP